MNVSRFQKEADTKVRLVGKCCESGDVLIDEIVMPHPQRGDVIAVFSTGAYNYSMASNYNRLPIPGMLLVSQGSYRWIIRPQTYDDLLLWDESLQTT